MNPGNKKTLNRRDFVTNNTIVIAAMNCLGPGAAIVHAISATDLATSNAVNGVMKGAVSNILEINRFLKESAQELEKLKAAKAFAAFAAVQSIVVAVITVVVACVINAFTAGAGAGMPALALISARAKINSSLNSLALWETEMGLQNKMTIEIRNAIGKFREIAENVKEVIVARDIFFHLSQDRTHAAKLLEAIGAKNRSTIEAMLKRDVPGSNIEVREVKEDNGILMIVPIGKFLHCFSTSSQCIGRTLTVAR